MNQSNIVNLKDYKDKESMVSLLNSFGTEEFNTDLFLNLLKNRSTVDCINVSNFSALDVILVANKKNNFGLNTAELWDLFKCADLSSPHGISTLSLLLLINKSADINFSSKKLWHIVEKTDLNHKKTRDILQKTVDFSPLILVCSRNKTEEINFSSQQIMELAVRTDLSANYFLHPLFYLLYDNKEQNLNLSQNQIMWFFNNVDLNIVDLNHDSPLSIVFGYNKTNDLNLLPEHIMEIVKKSDLKIKNRALATPVMTLLSFNKTENLNLTSSEIFSVIKGSDLDEDLRGFSVAYLITLFNKKENLNLSPLQIEWVFKKTPVFSKAVCDSLIKNNVVEGLNLDLLFFKSFLDVKKLKKSFPLFSLIFCNKHSNINFSKEDLVDIINKYVCENGAEVASSLLLCFLQTRGGFPMSKELFFDLVGKSGFFKKKHKKFGVTKKAIIFFEMLQNRSFGFYLSKREVIGFISLNMDIELLKNNSFIMNILNDFVVSDVLKMSDFKNG